MGILKDTADLIFPRTCDICGKPADLSIAGAFVCASCMSGVVPLKSGKRWQFCLSEPRTNDPYKDMRLYVPYSYEGSVSLMVHALKFGGRIGLGHLMGSLLGQCMLSDKVMADLIIPIPLSDRRLKERGYNQALVMAESLGKTLKIPVLKDVLKRTRDTKRQALFKDNIQRAENMIGAFYKDPSYELSDARIILLDDVVTTGSTLTEAAFALTSGEGDKGKILCCAFASNRAIKNSESY